jgi:methylenetetrahydrofolate reductase (NADPH)
MMPIQNYSSFQRMTSYCRTAVPQHIWNAIQPIAENDEAVKAYGVELSTSMCQELIAKGVNGFHFYTLNLENSVLSILKALHIEDTTATRRLRSLLISSLLTPLSLIGTSPGEALGQTSRV